MPASELVVDVAKIKKAAHNAIPLNILTYTLPHDIEVYMEEVLDVEEVHGHRFGVYLVVNLTIGIAPELTVAEGDRIATRVEEVLLEEIDLMRRVFVHYHPVRTGLVKAAPGPC